MIFFLFDIIYLNNETKKQIRYTVNEKKIHQLVN